METPEQQTLTEAPPEPQAAEINTTETGTTSVVPAPNPGDRPRRKRRSKLQRLEETFAEAESYPRPPVPEPPPVPLGDVIRALADLANRGDAQAKAQLRQFLDSHPEVWQQAGDLTRIAEKAWIECITGADPLSVELLKRTLAELKQELKGQHPTRLEALLVDQVGICWLALKHAEVQAAAPPGGSLEQAAFELRRVESAQKRYLNAVKTLTTTRALLGRGLAPLHSLGVVSLERQVS